MGDGYKNYCDQLAAEEREEMRALEEKYAKEAYSFTRGYTKAFINATSYLPFDALMPVSDLNEALFDHLKDLSFREKKKI